VNESVSRCVCVVHSGAIRAKSGLMLINYGRPEIFCGPPAPTHDGLQRGGRQKVLLSLTTTNSPPRNHLKMASS